MKITAIPLTEIHITERVLPVSRLELAGLMADIEERGLSTPIRVARRAKRHGYRLVSGARRLQAFSELGKKTIDCVIVRGSVDDLSRHELLDNLAQPELSALNEALSLAALKRLEMQRTGARHGGDHCSQGFRDKKASGKNCHLLSWYTETGQIRGKEPRTIRLITSLGERLCPKAAERVRGTRFERSQKELLALSNQPQAAQAEIAAILSDDETATVRSAVDQISGKIVYNQKDMSPSERWLAAFKVLWARAPAGDRDRRDALVYLEQLGWPESLGWEAAE